jgi:hypothetical protein
MDPKGPNRAASVLIASSAIGAFFLMFWVTQRAPGVSPDSVTYIETAQSLLDGKGFFPGSRPMTHFPPVYPLLLSIFGYFYHGDILQAGRLLCALLYSVNLALIGSAVWKCTHSLLATFFSVALFLGSSPIQYVHSMIWSEPLFIVLTLSAILLFERYIINESWCTLAWVALMAGLAMAARYAGAPLLPALIFAILLCSHLPMRARIKSSIFLFLIASIPIFSWMLRNVLSAQTAFSRTPAIHYFTASHAKWLIQTLHDFALPISTPLWIKAFYLFIAAVFFIFASITLRGTTFTGETHPPAASVLPATCTLFAMAYLLFLVVSVSFFDAAIPMDFRLILPAFLALAITVFSLIWSISKIRSQRLIRYSFILFLLLSFSLNLNSAVLLARYSHETGWGYSSREVQQSELLKYLENYPDDLKIYSNGPDVCYSTHDQ